MKVCLTIIYFFCSFAFAENKKEVLLYDPISVIGLDHQMRPAIAKGSEPKSIETNIFEDTIKSAITVLENSMRKTCTKEMETSISITADGKWAVVGVSITGAIKLLISNPEKPKTCSK